MKYRNFACVRDSVWTESVSLFKIDGTRMMEIHPLPVESVPEV